MVAANAPTDETRPGGRRPSVLVVSDVKKSYGETQALKGVSLSVDKGEIFGLLGPNGAGKTTLVSIIGTLLQPDGGSVTVDGHDLARNPREVRNAIGLAPQDIGLYDPLSAKANLEFFGGLYGLHGSELRARIDHAIEVAGLGDHVKKKVAAFSGGMKRRLSLAVALLHRPALLLLDEPTVGVDPQSRRHILESIREMSQSFGTTVVYTTHYMDEVEELCERVAIIDNGEIAACDAVRTMLAGYGSTVLLFRVPESERIAHRFRTEVIVEHLSSQDGLYQMGVASLQTALPLVLRIAEEEGVLLEDLRITRPSLEQVFISLTGRELRD